MSPAPAMTERHAAGGELALIERIRRRSARAFPGFRGELRLGIGDDCAILRPGNAEEVVVTTDFSLEGLHFRRDWHSPQSIGHRALARGLSDLAAMGARPMAAFLSLALPKAAAADLQWMDGFLDGVFALATRMNAPVAGGDTSASPSDAVLIDVVLIGAVPRRKALRRDGARAGDRLFVTGALGGAAAELRAVAKGSRPGASPANTAPRLAHHPHLFPEPRVKVGQALVRRGLAGAAIDLSDGLSTDLRHLCKASNVAAEVDARRLPLHPLTHGLPNEEAVRDALHGGEDYELLFTARPRTKVPRRIAGVPITEVGRIVERQRGRPPVSLIHMRGRATELKPGGWEHLR